MVKLQYRTAKKNDEAAEKFSKWLSTLTIEQHATAGKRIREACFASLSVYNNWRRGRTRIPELCRKEIDRIAVSMTGSPVFDFHHQES